MGDALSSLILAISRVAAELRARRKKKRPQRPGGPRPSGPNANKGCGTGAGGFGKGNSCAKEDGIPNAPRTPFPKQSDAKSDLAKAAEMKKKAAEKQAAKIAADKAKSEANRPAREKRLKIAALRKAAAKRKEEKGEREAAAKQAAAEAAAKKRAAMLQKIRVKKANEQIKIVEKPAGRFSGQVDGTIAKNPGETQFQFAQRRIDADIKRLHKELDAVDSSIDARSQSLKNKIEALDAEAKAAFNERRALERQIAQGGADATKEQKAELDRLFNKYLATKAAREAAWKEQDGLAKKHTEETHAVVSEFVKTHAGGLMQVDAGSQFLNPSALKKSKSQFRDAFVANAKKAWSFLSSVSSPMHQQKASQIKVHLDGKKGSADYNDTTEVARHGTKGRNADYHVSDRVIVHEIAHGLHYGAATLPPLPRQPGLPPPLPRANRDSMAATRAVKEDYDLRVSEFKAMNQGQVDLVVFHPERQSYRLFVPRGQPRLPRTQSYLGYANQYCDAENGNPTGATEVISVGVETMYAEPRRFRSLHRSHFDLTLLFLAGRLH